jgi:light-independent protochlorophyllide reductase subunit B
MVRTLASAEAQGQPRTPRAAGVRPRCNILGPTALGFRHRDDLKEITSLLASLGVDVHVVAPLGASPADLARLHEADFNVLLYPEIASVAAQWLTRQFQQPCTRTVPIGVHATRDFIREVAGLAGIDCSAVLAETESRADWYAKSVDSTYLTGKRVFVFGDATHVVAAARVATQELGFTVVGLGTYSRELAREVRDAAKLYGVEALITDDYLEVEERIAELQPELVLGSQMERHIAKRLGVPCAVISAPVHVQDFPARYSPQMGFEGANVLFDTWVHPLMMGLEEHLIGMFRGDAEFHEDAAPSHLGGGIKKAAQQELQQEAQQTAAPEAMSAAGVEAAPVADTTWGLDAEKELRKIPFFVRGKAKRNTEMYARERGLPLITVDTLYDAKAHFSR